MEKIGGKISICHSNPSSESDSLHSLMEEIQKNKTESFKELKYFESLSSSISTQYKGISENNVAVATSDICRKYLAAPKKIKNDHERYNAAAMKFHMEEIKMKREIRELERKLNSSLQRNQIILKDVTALQKQKVATQEALCLAKKYYTSVWDMNIHIKDSKEDRFTCIINFKFDCGMYPIKFVVDRNNQEILDWNASSLLTPEEENEMKDRYSTTDYYFPHVLSELRLIALNKIKMS